jgi:hypothetical protein
MRVALIVLSLSAFGAGEIVKELGRRGVDAFGCDVFYEGGDYSKSLAPELPGGVIVRTEGDTIPFDGASFDLFVPWR